MAIRGLNQNGVAAFKGKQTSKNLSAMDAGTMLSAKNVLILDDGQLRRAPGYTLVTTIGTGPIKGQPYDFQRNVDEKQFVFIQSGSEIWTMNADGSGKVRLSTGETGTHQFVCNSFAAYSSDGHNAWRYVDVGGTLTKYQWGITPPATAPGISTSAGTLTLTYGRAYVVCYVSKYTDSLGIQRVSVSAPSPLTAHTGPVASQVVTLTSIPVSTDPQVNYKWIFATSDSPYDTSATFYFAAEITNATTSWGDTLPDDALDQTRLAPFDNFPAPPAPLLAMFQNHIVAASGNLIQYSGYAEIGLGIPEEAWPVANFFTVPSGKRTISALDTSVDGTVLYVATQDWWFRYLGYDATTLTEQDHVARPGAAGAYSSLLTPRGLAYMSATQTVWLWDGNAGEGVSISDDIAKPLKNTYSMTDIDVDTIGQSIICWYDYGPMNLLLVFCRTADYTGQGLNWMQIWSFANGGISMTDKFPTDGITAAGPVSVGFQGNGFIFMGDSVGNVYRWPDGYLDNTNPVISLAQMAWALPNNGQSRYYWIDMTTDRQDARDSFQIYAACADAPDMNVRPIWLIDVQNLPNPKDRSLYTVRASMNRDNLATGKFVTAWIAFPQDDQDAAVRVLEIDSRPVNKGLA